MFLYVLIVVGVTVHFPGLRIYAKETLPDEIRLENEAYEKHKKGIVVFSHKQHAETYAQKLPGLYAAGCGECHHDENNNKAAHQGLKHPKNHLSLPFDIDVGQAGPTVIGTALLG